MLTGPRIRNALILLVIAVLAPMFIPSVVAADSQPVSTATSSSDVGTFTVSGQVTTPLTLTANDLRRGYRGHSATSHFIPGCVTQGHVYRGALLTEILATAGPKFDPAIKSVKLRYAVLVSASDGYQAVLSWGEIDPDFANTQVLLVYEQDGTLLPRPHLVVPGDKQGGRYVCNITSLNLLQIKP